MRIHLLSPLLILLVLPACRHTAPQTPHDRPAAVPVVADDNLNAVLWMQASAEYRAAALQTWGAATDRRGDARADPRWDAPPPAERGNPALGLPPAVIVDGDETVLDNSP